MADTKKNLNTFAAIAESVVTKSMAPETNETAIDTVIYNRVNAEIERRAALLEKGLEKYISTKKALASCGPDQSVHIVSGKEGEEGETFEQKSFSPKRMQELQKLRKDLANLDAAFLKVTSESNYEQLMKLVSGGGQEKGKGNDKSGENVE